MDVLVDRRRQLATLDPDGREMYISVGAALLNLRLAIGVHGRWPRVRLLPDAQRPDVAATVQIGTAVPVPPAERLLAQAIHRRRTSADGHRRVDGVSAGCRRAPGCSSIWGWRTPVAAASRARTGRTSIGWV